MQHELTCSNTSTARAVCDNQKDFRLPNELRVRAPRALAAPVGRLLFFSVAALHYERHNSDLTSPLITSQCQPPLLLPSDC